jgi:hypothetical protein
LSEKRREEKEEENGIDGLIYPFKEGLCVVELGPLFAIQYFDTCTSMFKSHHPYPRLLSAYASMKEDITNDTQQSQL